jgi:hypothetical protein
VSVSGCKLGQRPTRTETRAKAPKLNARLTFAHSGSSLRYCIPRNESDGDQIPSLSWNYVPIKTQADNLVWDPVLAFGWGTNVRFMQLVDRGDDKPVNFKTLGTFTSKVKIISIRWLSERVIMTMDRQVNCRAAAAPQRCCSMLFLDATPHPAWASLQPDLSRLLRTPGGGSAIVLTPAPCRTAGARARD